MTSPVPVKVTRPVPPWPKDYHTSVGELETYFWRPILYREHLGLTETSKQVEKCKPYPEHVECSSQVVKELNDRDTHVNQEGKRCLESGWRGDDIDVESFCKRSLTSHDGPFKTVRTREEVDSCNGSELPCRLVFPWAFLTTRSFVLTMSRRSSTGFPSSKNHSLDSSSSPNSWSQRRRSVVVMQSSRVSKQGLCRDIQWRRGWHITRRSTRSFPKMNTSLSGFTSSPRWFVWRYTPLCVTLCTSVSNLDKSSNTAYYEY